MSMQNSLFVGVKIGSTNNIKKYGGLKGQTGRSFHTWHTENIPKRLTLNAAATNSKGPPSYTNQYLSTCNLYTWNSFNNQAVRMLQCR